MKILMSFFVCILFSTNSFAQIKDPDLSYGFNLAAQKYLNSTGYSVQSIGCGNDKLLYQNYVTTFNVLQNSDQWVIDGEGALSPNERIIKLRQNIVTHQRPFIKNRYKTANYYYFIHQKDKPQNRLILTAGATVYFRFAQDSQINTRPLADNLCEQLRTYAKEKNIYRKGVLEFNPNYNIVSFFNGAEKLNLNWDQLILDEKLKKSLIDIFEDFLKNYDYSTWKKYGLPLSRGALISGPPGTGKSLLGKILASQVMNAKYPQPFTYIHIQARHILSVEDVRRVFDIARYFGRTILYIEDIDLIAGTNRFNRAEIKNEFMQQLSGIEPLEGVLTIGTTNLASEIDPAMKRSQRLGFHFNFSTLSYPERLELSKVFLSKYDDHTGKINYIKLATQTEGFTGADLQQLVLLSLDLAVKDVLKNDPSNKVYITDDFLNKAFELRSKNIKTN